MSAEPEIIEVNKEEYILLTQYYSMRVFHRVTYDLKFQIKPITNKVSEEIKKALQQMRARN